ncbi:MAG TPA: hypothetical protein VNU97_10390 [Rhizomicrobium sp.]|jgi:hypothetical protein|nr:hypothetical protein [Rhizomicrobium sp.]
MMDRLITAVAIVGIAYGVAAAAPANDPPSGRVDPPPGVLDYVGAFPLHQWTFGKLLWRGREACTADDCEAAFNATPLFALVQRERNCCGEPGYSIMVTVRAKDCAAVSYYLAFSRDIEPLPIDQRSTLVGRKLGQLVAGIQSACGVADVHPITTAEINGLANDPKVTPQKR